MGGASSRSRRPMVLSYSASLAPWTPCLRMCGVVWTSPSTAPPGASHEGVVPAARHLCRPRHAMNRPVAVRRVDVCRRSRPGHRDSTVVDTSPSSRPSHARRGAGRGHRGDRPCRLGDTVVLVPGVLTGRSADQVAAVAEIAPDPSRSCAAEASATASGNGRHQEQHDRCQEADKCLIGSPSRSGRRPGRGSARRSTITAGRPPARPGSVSGAEENRWP